MPQRTEPLPQELTPPSVNFPFHLFLPSEKKLWPKKNNSKCTWMTLKIFDVINPIICLFNFHWMRNPAGQYYLKLRATVRVIMHGYRAQLGPVKRTEFPLHALKRSVPKPLLARCYNKLLFLFLCFLLLFYTSLARFSIFSIYKSFEIKITL